MKHTIDSSRGCDHWIGVARDYLEASEETTRESAYAGLRDHVESCPDCQREIGGLLETDRSLQQAFAFLDHGLPSPPQESLAVILARARSSPDTSRLLKRARRPVNTILWISVILCCFAALAGLIWCAVWLGKRLAG